MTIIYGIAGILAVLCGYAIRARVINIWVSKEDKIFDDNGNEIPQKYGFKTKHLILGILFGWIPVINIAWVLLLLIISFAEASANNQIAWPNKSGNWIKKRWNQRLW